MLRKVFYVLGKEIIALSGLMLIPALIDVTRAHNYGCAIGSMFCCFIGGLLFFSCKRQGQSELQTREIVILVLLSWIIVPTMSALPFVISYPTNAVLDTIFEVVSALTTTGNVILEGRLSDGLLVWRGLLQLLGSVSYIMACLYAFSRFVNASELNAVNVSCIKLLKIVGGVYALFIITAWGALVMSGMSTVNAICNALAAISSGGMLCGTIPVDAYWILSALMFTGGISATFWWRLLWKKHQLYDEQFYYYVSTIAIGALLLNVYIYCSTSFDLEFWDSLRQAAFSITSSITTTVFPSNVYFDKWIDAMLYVCNFCGGCFGSGTGGIKFFRIIMLCVIMKAYLQKMITPREVCFPSYAGRRLSDYEISAFFSYFVCYLILAVIFALLISAEMEFGKAFGAAITTMSNSGTFFGMHKAEIMELKSLSSISKCVLITAMIAGRVEYVTFFAILMKTFWKR